MFGRDYLVLWGLYRSGLKPPELITGSCRAAIQKICLRCFFCKYAHRVRSELSEVTCSIIIIFRRVFTPMFWSNVPTLLLFFLYISMHIFWMKFSACVKRPDDYISSRYATTIRGGYQEQLTELLSCSKRWSDQIIASFIVVVISIIIIFPFFGLLSCYNKWISPEMNTVLSYYNTIINLLLSQWCYWERWMCLNESKLTVIIQI